MPIVDFAQDPTAPYGTGNFRDDKGRVMYLHDPETAQQFAKTMPGAKLAGDVASESDAIAQRQMGDPGATLGSQVATESDAIARQQLGGAPSRGPDLRLAEHRPPEPEYYDPNAAGRDLRASVDAPTGAGADLVAQYTQTRSALDEPPAAGAAAPGAPAPAPGAPPGAPAAPGAAPGAPPPAGAPGGAGAALVQNYSAAQGKLGARTQPRDIEMPKPYGSGNIPLSGVREGQSVSIDEGRPVANALEQLADEAPDVQNQIDQLRKGGAERDAAVDRGYGMQLGGLDATRQAQLDRANKAAEERKAAERELAVVQRELRDNDTKIDPDRVVKNMSTGSRIGMIVLAMLNGAFGATIGQKNNGVLDALNLEIDRDIDRQKNEVANRKASLSNDYKRYLDMGLDAKQAEALARDKAESALLQYKDLEAKRAGAVGEYTRQAEQAIAPLRVAWSQRRGDVMKETEAKVKRTQDVSKANELPKEVALTPQDVMALLNVKKERIEQANTAAVEAALGHPVSPEESARLKQDSQEFAAKHAQNETTRGNIRALAEALKLRQQGAAFSGTPDPGIRPLGSSQLDPQARRIDRLWSAVSEAKVMGMAREPAARLQEMYGQAIERPFNDSDIPQLLSDVLATVDRADANLRKGYGEAATLWDNTPDRPPPRPGVAPPRAPPGKPAPTAAQRAAAEAERKKTGQMLRDAAPGGMRNE